MLKSQEGRVMSVHYDDIDFQSLPSFVTSEPKRDVMEPPV